jgi:AraC family transcriptional regulator
MRGEVPLRTVSASLEADGDNVQATGFASDANRSVRSVASAAERVRHLIRRAILFLESDRQAARRFLKDASALLELQRQEFATSGPGTGGLKCWQAERTMAYIEANLGSKMDIRELAALVAFTKSHFSRGFKKSFGLPPMAYVVTRRVERAKIMMTSTTDQLAQIALACGFADQSHLNRCFHRIVGVSPGRWRRTNREAVDLNVRPWVASMPVRNIGVPVCMDST